MTARLAIVGSRTTRERDARGEGLEVFDTSTTPWTHLGGVACTNPTFLAAGPREGQWYVVHGDGHEVSRLEVSPGGRATLHESVDCGGTNPVHLCRVGGWLAVVNHSGSVTTIRIEPDGSLGALTGRVDLEGDPGPHATDQGRARPHQVVAVDEGHLLVPDKGLDTVFSLALDQVTGRLDVIGSVRLRQLSGPRHLALHPELPTAYTIDELSSTVTVLDRAAELRPLQVHATLPPDLPGDSRGAEVLVSPDGRWVLASNRSGAGDRTPGGPHDDTVAVFPVLPDGRLTAPHWVSTGGIRPRFMCFDEDGSLVVANERSGSIRRLYPEEPEAGSVKLARTGSPVCVVFQ